MTIRHIRSRSARRSCWPNAQACITAEMLAAVHSLRLPSAIPLTTDSSKLLISPFGLAVENGETLGAAIKKARGEHRALVSTAPQPTNFAVRFNHLLSPVTAGDPL